MRVLDASSSNASFIHFSHDQHSSSFSRYLRIPFGTTCQIHSETILRFWRAESITNGTEILIFTTVSCHCISSRSVPYRIHSRFFRCTYITYGSLRLHSTKRRSSLLISQDWSPILHIFLLLTSYDGSHLSFTPYATARTSTVSPLNSSGRPTVPLPSQSYAPPFYWSRIIFVRCLYRIAFRVIQSRLIMSNRELRAAMINSCSLPIPILFLSLWTQRWQESESKASESRSFRNSHQASSRHL